MRMLYKCGRRGWRDEMLYKIGRLRQRDENNVQETEERVGR